MTDMKHTVSPMTLRGISSMATKAVLADLAAQYEAQTGVQLSVESVGGVDAAKRVQAGEAFDVVLLASDAIDKLIASGHLQTGSRSDWVDSPVAVAVPAGQPLPAIGSEAQVRQAVMDAPSLSYSTGPSGVYLEKLFARWGLLEQLKSRIVVPPPGTPVGMLVAQGKAALGFQQLSELIALPGLAVVGCLPPDVAYITTFSAGVPLAVAQDAARAQAVKDFLAFLAGTQALPIKQRHGMNWAR
jgi:molybdate transport system substrate-binding protein